MNDAPAKRILVVDDDTFVLTMISRLLRRAGYDVFEAMRAEQAISAVGTTAFDAVLTDIFMPGIGGIEGIIRIHAVKPNLPIIAMSAGYDEMTSEKATEAALKIGAVAVLSKPVEQAELIAAVEKALGGA